MTILYPTPGGDMLILAGLLFLICGGCGLVADIASCLFKIFMLGALIIGVVMIGTFISSLH